MAKNLRVYSPYLNITNGKYFGDINDFLRFNTDLSAHRYARDALLLPSTVRAWMTVISQTNGQEEQSWLRSTASTNIT